MGVYTAIPHAAIAASFDGALISCFPPTWPAGRRLHAIVIAVAVSRRKHLFSSAACSGVRGGTNRVFTRPACGALVMTANAQRPLTPGAGRFGARTRTCFIV